MCLHSPHVEGVSAHQADAARPQARKSSLKPLFKFTVLRAHACTPKGLPGPPPLPPPHAYPKSAKLQRCPLRAHSCHAQPIGQRSGKVVGVLGSKTKGPRIETTLRNLQVFVESTACCLSRRVRGLH